MAKKKKIVEEHKSEPVTNCDQSKEVVTNCDNQQFAVTIGDHKNIDIKSMIRVIRSQQVMLDFELAMLYGVETKALNQAVKRNINRFPDDFMFQLTKNELESLRSQIVTSNSTEKQQDTNWKSQIVTSNPSHNDGAKILMSQNATSNFAKMGLRRPPYAFTRNGIGMLSSVLRSETAVGVNILIMRAFTAIPQIVNQNVQMVQRIFNIEQHQMETDEKIELILDKIEEIAPKQLPHKNHDRFLIIDDSVYLLGTSVKDMGNGLCAVTKLQALPETILGMLK